MSHYPTISQLEKTIAESTDKKSVLFETRKSLRSILSKLLMFIGSAAIVTGLNLFFPSANLFGFFTSGVFISIRWLAVIPAFYFLEVLRQYHDDLYTFTPHNLTHYDGRLSLKYNIPNVRYVDIRAVVVIQDIFGRILDYGDIEIDTAAQEVTELYMKGIRAPAELAELIESLRELSKKSIRKNNPAVDAREIEED
jgi:hypothetical protein